MMVAMAVVALLWGCQSEPEGEEVEEQRPLRPLMYTEDPELTAEGAEVRERRLRRQLVGGEVEAIVGREFEAWEDDLDLSDDEALGEAMVEALVSRDPARWEALFVDVEDYMDLVGVDQGRAEEFVDNQIGGSLELWELFGGFEGSEASDQGLEERLSLDEVRMGRGRRIDGSAASDPDEVVQYWDSTVVVADEELDLRFEIEMERIFWIGDGEAGGRLQVASPMEVDDRFRTLFDVGFHLKAELLRSAEYPFPLGVGTFWRYRRYDRAEGIEEEEDLLDQRLDEESEGPQATEVVVEVRSVARYGKVRLIELLRSYDDRRYTRTREWWAITPRQIYGCNEACRANIDDPGWLLGYFARETPILVFPLETGQRWGAGGHDDAEGAFKVGDSWERVETPAGTFVGTYVIEGRGAVGWWDHYLSVAQVVRYFSPTRGIVRQDVRGGPEGGEIVEELVEYRIME